VGQLTKKEAWNAQMGLTWWSSEKKNLLLSIGVTKPSLLEMNIHYDLKSSPNTLWISLCKKVKNADEYWVWLIWGIFQVKRPMS